MNWNGLTQKPCTPDFFSSVSAAVYSSFVVGGLFGSRPAFCITALL